MKKFSAILLLLCAAFSSFGKQVPLSTAKTAGYNYLTLKGSDALQSPADLKLLYTSGSAPALFYVFGTDHSFVIIAADDAVIPVLGYSLDNTFTGKNIPAHIAGFLNGMNEQITYVKDNHVAAVKEIENKWDNLVNNTAEGTASKTTTVSPLLACTWNQSPYYNANCPYDASGGGLSVTGCVATATAQVMKFWGWPATGSGFHSYSTSSYGTLSANFSAHTYNWSAMPNNVTAANSAVALLMSDVGISVDMSYSASSSGAYVISAGSAVTNCAEYALKTYFNYDPSLRGLKRASYSDAAWITMLEADLTAGRPIIYDGHGTGGGHCFVFDGFDASDNFHVNWGWGGAYNGYFAINALNPSGTGTGGGSGGYNSGQEAILGVKPNGSTGGGGGGPTSDTLALYDYVNLTSSTINYGSAFTVTTEIGNFGYSSFSGDYCAAAFNYTTGNFVCFIDSIMGTSLPSGYSSGTLTFSTSGLLPMVPGNYTIGIFHRRTGGNWQATWNYSPYSNFVNMLVVNHNPIELTMAMTTTPSTLVQGSAGTVTLNLGNYSSSAYSGNYDVSLYNLDGSLNSTIQTLSGMSLAVGATYSTALTFTTSSITATPGTYILAVMYSVGSSYYLAGADYHTNPVYINVVAPAPIPDMYEVNNTAATAYNLPLTFTANVATASTTGANFHVTSDQDYYKIVLAPGFNYAVTARINDIISKDDAATYTVNANWTYSTDNGTTWSVVYNDVMTGASTINFTGGTGGSVIFHVSPAYAGNLGKYLLKISNVTRSAIVSIPAVDASAVMVYPNPAQDVFSIDLNQSNVNVRKVTVTDIKGKTVLTQQGNGASLIKVPVHKLADGNYILDITTENGTIRKKITIAK
ncbi:MAG: C10 family peptidase [Taibaiella sp.]|nr:C10 family peptidase [Taibaiella sp.]